MSSTSTSSVKINLSQFSFLPLLLETIRQIKTEDNAIKARRTADKLMEKFNACKSIITGLPGASLNTEQQLKIIAELREILRRKQEIIDSHKLNVEKLDGSGCIEPLRNSNLWELNSKPGQAVNIAFFAPSANDALSFLREKMSELMAVETTKLRQDVSLAFEEVKMDHSPCFLTPYIHRIQQTLQARRFACLVLYIDRQSFSRRSISISSINEITNLAHKHGAQVLFATNFSLRAPPEHIDVGWMSSAKHVQNSGYGFRGRALRTKAQLELASPKLLEVSDSFDVVVKELIAPIKWMEANVSHPATQHAAPQAT